MKNKGIIITLIIIIMSSCALPSYLPSSDKIDINQHGSYIKVTRRSNANVKGELIAVDIDKIIILSKKTKNCISVPKDEVMWFKIRYARPKSYGWSIPLGIVLPFMHGFYSIITLPIHLITTISIAASGRQAYKLNNRTVNYDRLNMFSRFPQGIPQHIDPVSIK